MMKEMIYSDRRVRDIVDVLNITLENTASAPNPIFVSTLQQKLGHASVLSTIKYINTALKLQKK